MTQTIWTEAFTSILNPEPRQGRQRVAPGASPELEITEIKAPEGRQKLSFNKALFRPLRGFLPRVHNPGLTTGATIFRPVRG